MTLRETRTTLASHVPVLLLDQLAVEGFAGPARVPCRGAALFADVSGFTALTERYSRELSGLEELTARLNASFGRLVHTVEAHGGDIAKFAGDALIVLWPEAPAVLGESRAGGGLDEATLRAVQCGLAIEQALGQGDLNLKLVIGAGELTVYHLGGERGRWEIILAGQALKQLAQTFRRAEPGRLLLSPEAWSRVADRCEGRADGEGFGRVRAVTRPVSVAPRARPSLSEALLEGAARYIPAAVRGRVQRGEDAWLAELRRISVVFVGLPGLEDSLPLETVQGVARDLQSCLSRYEGQVNKFSVDEKGVSMLGALGLPPLAHEDDPLRAVKAGFAIAAALKGRGLRAPVGIATGVAFCGVIGSEERCEYTVIGDVVNLAARLMQRAHDGVLCDEATRRVVGEQVVFEEPEPLDIRGKQEPVSVYRALRAIARSQKYELVTGGCIGRAGERASIQEALDGLSAGRGGALVITGEAGIGKTRLLEDLERRGRAAGARVFYGVADAIEREAPYNAWRGLFSELLGLDDEAPAPQDQSPKVRSFLETETQPELLRMAPLFNEVLSLGLPENELTENMTGEVRAENTRRFLLDVLKRAVAERPAIIILEDAHWLDSASWSLLRQIWLRIKPLLIAVAHRPFSGSAPREFEEVLAAPSTRALSLEPMPPEDVLRLVSRKLGVAELPTPVRRLILDKAHGNPFFSEELAFSLRDAGQLVIADGQARLAPDAGDLEGSTVPDTVQGVVTARLDRLLPNEQMALKVAAVIGRVFSVRALDAIVPLEELRARLPELLAGLEERGLISRVSPEPRPAYLFKHKITQEVAYNLMLFAQRRGLHRAAAEWYERAHRDDLAPHYPVLAHHWSTAEEGAKAIAYLERAGEQALRNHANEECIAFLERALSLDAEQDEPSPRGRRARWRSQLGEALYALADYAKSLVQLQQAVELRGYAEAPSTLRRGLAIAWQTLGEARHRLLWRRPLAPPEQRGELLEVARAYERMANIHYLSNDRVASIYASLRALNSGERAGPSGELARSLANMCVVAGLSSRHRLAEHYALEAAEVARGIDDPSTQGYVFVVTSLFRMSLGRLAEAREDLEQALAGLNDHGDLRRLDECRVALARLLYRMAEYPASTELYHTLLESGLSRRILQVQLWGLEGLLANQMRTGLELSTLDELERILEENRETDKITQSIYASSNGWLAAANLRLGKPEAARRFADIAYAVIQELGIASHYHLEGCSAAAQAYLELWSRAPEDRELKRICEGLCAKLRDFSTAFPFALPQLLLAHARRDAILGRTLKARRQLERCLDASDAYNLPFERTLASSWLVGTEGVSSQRRIELLAAARRKLEELGAKGDLSQPPFATADRRP